MTVTHDLNVLPAGSERMDDYLTRRWPGRVASWYAECDRDNIQIRDHYPYDKVRWFIQWWDEDAQQWVRLGDLEDGRRPRMHNGYCYVVDGGASPSSPR